MVDKEDNVYIARLAEQAERYDEMVTEMKNIAQTGVGLNPEERNLLSVAYKNVIGSRRASWRIITSLEQKGSDNEIMNDTTTKYRKEVEKELQDICTEILDLLDSHLIPQSKQHDGSSSADGGSLIEAEVFYYKMKGDYLRYLAEFSVGTDRTDAATNSLGAYKIATDKATNLGSTHPIRLGLALNYSVFFYEILNSPAKACKLAKEAFDKAIAELDSIDEEKYKDSTLIMQLLRDNLTLWTSDCPKDEELGQGDGETPDEDTAAADADK